MTDTRASTVVDNNDEVSEESGFFKMEFDDELNGDKDLVSGVEAFFWIHHGVDIKADGFYTSDGVVEFVGAGVRESAEEFEINVLDTEYELNFIPAGGVEFSYKGNHPGVNQSGRSLKFYGEVPAVVKVTYSYMVMVYKLIPPESLYVEKEDEYEINIVCKYTVIKAVG